MLARTLCLTLALLAPGCWWHHHWHRHCYEPAPAPAPAASGPGSPAR
jgi:hypothetical protein